MESLRESQEKKIHRLETQLTRVTREKDRLEQRHVLEVEGFKNDILAQKKQLTALENQLLRIGPIADAELALLDMGKLRIRDVSGYSTGLPSYTYRI